MFLRKKECDLIKKISSCKNEGLYKLARPLFSMKTIDTRSKYLLDKGFIELKEDGRKKIPFLTKKGHMLLDLIMQIEEIQ